MNLSPRLVAALSEAGFESLHWSSVGPPEASDTAVMAFARNYDFVTIDLPKYRLRLLPLKTD